MDGADDAVQPFFGAVWKGERMHRLWEMREDVPAASASQGTIEESRFKI